MIDCQNISLSFKEKQLFSDFNLQVKQGEFVSISGDSGRGKTTVLKMLQGYVVPDKGSIKIMNKELIDSNLSEIRKSITWIPQNVNLPVKNGKELTELLNITPNIPKIEDLLNLLGLEKDFIMRNFQKISGGQKQRVIIAICLSMDKPLVLMDEPTSSLDEGAIELLLQTIRSMKGTTFVTASHNVTWVNNADRIIDLATFNQKSANESN
jgi:polar amino acid transport system ATP-binding protein/putative ABC transport system ATP-binding protein